MATFEDEKQRSWEVRIDAPTIEEIRQTLNIDIISLDPKDRIWERLHDDLVLAVQVLTIIVAPQLKDANVTPRDFGASLVGDALDNGQKALEDAIAFFFPPERRDLLRNLNETNRKTVAKGMMMAVESLDNLTPEVEAAMKKRIDGEMKKALIRLETVTDTPEWSESRLTD